MNHNPVAWRPVKIPGMENLSELYSVSELGEVRSLRTNRVLSPLSNQGGYLFNKLCFGGKIKCVYIHRIVALAFLENPEGKPQVNHIDGVKGNNRLSNLEWVTSSENHLHSARCLSRRYARGEDNGTSVLSESDVKQMRAWWKTGSVTQEDIARTWKVSFQNVSAIVNNLRWRHVSA